VGGGRIPILPGGCRQSEKQPSIGGFLEGSIGLQGERKRIMISEFSPFHTGDWEKERGVPGCGESEGLAGGGKGCPSLPLTVGNQELTIQDVRQRRNPKNRMAVKAPGWEVEGDSVKGRGDLVWGSFCGSFLHSILVLQKMRRGGSLCRKQRLYFNRFI